MHWSAAYADFNVFRRKLQPLLRCAVRQDRAVPAFIHGETWEFSGTVMGEVPPPGFRMGDAIRAVQFPGYYLFQVPRR